MSDAGQSAGADDGAGERIPTGAGPKHRLPKRAAGKDSPSLADCYDVDTDEARASHWRALIERRRGRGGARGDGDAAETDADGVAEDASEGDDGDRIRRRWPWWIEYPVLIIVAFLLTFFIQAFVARVYYVPSGSMEQTIHGVQHGGDRILAYKLGYDFGDPHQGDIVVFRGPATWTPRAKIPGPQHWWGKLGQSLGSMIGIAPPDEKDFVKRVIAVGGQTISCCDAQGRVRVDGVSLHEPYLYMEPNNAARSQWRWLPGVSNCRVDADDPNRYNSFRCFGPYTVPDGDVWVMGDHRVASADSTYHCRGLVPADNVQCQGPIPVDNIVGRAVAIVMPPSRWGGLGSPDIMSGDVDDD